MSALEKLQNYYSLRNKVATTIFDTKTPEGAFLNGVHSNGFKLYENMYFLKDENLLTKERKEEIGLTDALSISEASYENLLPFEKNAFELRTEYTELYHVLTTTGNQCINAIAGAGKALTLDTKLMTPDGLIPIGDLNVGDFVYGEDGKAHLITGYFPQGKKRVYNVTLNTGKVVECCGEHLWTYEDENGDIVTVSTENLVASKENPLVLPAVLPLVTESSIFSKYSEDVFRLLARIIKHEMFNYLVLDTTDEDYVFGLVDSLGLRYQYADAGFYVLEDKINAKISVSELKDLVNVLNGCDATLIPVNLRKAYMESILVTSANCDNCVVTDTIFATKRDEQIYVANSLGIATWTDFCQSEAFIYYDSEFKKNIYSVYYNMKDLDNVLRCSIISVEATDVEKEMACIMVDNPSHLYLIDGAVPTHNTTALVFKIIHDIVTGECTTMKQVPNGITYRAVDKVWVCTFLRTGAEELKDALLKWQRKLGYTETGEQIVFSTLDAEFKRCLNAMGVATNIGKDSVLFSLMKKAIDSCNITNGGAPLTKEDYQIIGSIITYHRGRLDQKRYQHPSMSDYSIMPRDLDIIVSQFASLRRAEGIVDFDEIQELLYKYLYVTPNKAVQDFVASRYKYIYIDEFQDTSQMQYAILKFYARGHLWMNCGGEDKVDVDAVGGLYTAEETQGKIVAIGDPSQCLTADVNVGNTGIALKPITEIRNGDYVRSYSCDLQKECVTQVIGDVIETPYKGDIITITAENGKKFSVTPQHKFYRKIVLKHVNNHYNSCDIFVPEVETSWLALLKPMGYAVYRRGNGDGLFKHNSYYTSYDALIIDMLTKTKLDNITFIVEVDNFSVTYMEVDAEKLAVGDCLLHTEPKDSYTKVTGVSITGIEKTHYEGKVYDINTKNHMFAIEGGFLVHNCIYSFKGSDSRILVEEFDKDFRPVLCRLSTNYRCPRNILEPIVPSIHQNADSANQVITAYNDGGEFNAYSFANYKAMVNQLVIDLNRDMTENNKVAILCRTNFDGTIPAFILESEKKFNFGISGENMTLDSPLPKKLVNVASLFMERSTPAVKATLSMFVSRNETYALNKLIDTLKMNNMWIWEVPKADIDYSVPSLSRMIDGVKQIIYKNGVHDKNMDLEALRFVYFDLMVNVFRSQSAYSLSAKAYISSLLYIIESRNYKTVYDFVEDLDIINTRLHGRIGKRTAPIQIATVHEFKGKERDSIIIWNDSEGSFPSSKCDIEDEEQLAEERRVHYIACTRAKKRSTIYTLQDRIGMFVKEMNVSLKTPITLSASLKKN